MTRAESLRRLAPGVALAVLVAALAVGAERALGGATMLYALLLGIALHAAGRDARVLPGVEFCARQVLRLGVALLGLRITLGDVAILGWSTAALAAGGVVLTLVAGSALARALGLQRDFAILTAGAVAICGASAALAIAAVLPQRPEGERQTLLTVVGVTTLSTIAMVLYPMLARALGFDELTAGKFFGASIHDVAQVVGAGLTVSDATVETATLVKLMRVACLAPVVMLIAWQVRRRAGAARGDVPGLPAFLIGFVALVGINSTGVLPVPVTSAVVTLTGYLLVLAVAALGLKTSLRGLASLGVKPLLAMVGQTLLLGGAVLGVLLLGG